MEITRNQYFWAGVVLFLLGIQFLQIDSFELKEGVARFIAERSDHPLISVSAQSPVLGPVAAAAVNRVMRPPDWLGWMFLSFGIVGTLHALAMPKQG
jgi:hypothetical protein